MKHVGVDIVTGFLGSGKTSLLAHAMKGVLARPDVVFIVNEIGEIGLDGRVLTGFESVERLVELTSGCICCSIEDASFDVAIADLVGRFDPALLVIETTGLADPRVLEERVARAGLGLDAVIAVVDAANFRRTAEATKAGRAQVAAADFLVVNKLDLCPPTEAQRLRRRLRRLNGRAALLDAVRGETRSELLFGLGAGRLRKSAGAPPRADHLECDGISALCLRTDKAVDRRRFERFLARLPTNVLRAKGAVRFAGSPWLCVFNYTCGRYELNWVQYRGACGGGEAVFIGTAIRDAEAALAAELARCETD